MANIQYWGKLLIKFVSVQLIVQALGFSSGILIINNLSKADYSYYLLANTMQFTMDLMADFGITIGLNSIGGKIWQDSNKFSQLIATAFSIRRYLLIASTIIVVPILATLLFNNGANLPTIITLIFAVLVELQFYSTSRILGIVPRLNSNVNLIQKLDFILAFTRIIGLFIALTFGINVVTATLSSTCASGIYSFLLSRWVRNKVDLHSQIDVEYRSQILSLIKTQFLPTVFYCLQGQIAIWIITIFGRVSGIAEIGALSRLGLILTIVNPVINSIIVPSYARCQSIDLLRKRSWQLIAIFMLISGGILCGVNIFSEQLLWILGRNYTHLGNELTLVMVSSLITSLTTMIWGLNYAKAWVNNSWLIIPSTISMQVLLIFILDLSTVRGTIIFGLFSAIPPLVVNLYMNNHGIKMMAAAVQKQS